MFLLVQMPSNIGFWQKYLQNFDPNSNDPSCISPIGGRNPYLGPDVISAVILCVLPRSFLFVQTFWDQELTHFMDVSGTDSGLLMFKRRIQQS